MIGDVLWTPPADLRQTTEVGRLMAWLEDRRGLKLSSYEALQRWSVDDLEGFWSAVWEFYEIRAHAPYTRVLGRRTMPGAEWFEGARLNYAEHLVGRDEDRDTVAVIQFSGILKDAWKDSPTIISRQYDSFSADAACAETSGKTVLTSLVSSHYFGNWKHDTCAQKMESPNDRVEFTFRFLEPGDYRVILDYACLLASKDREGIVQVGTQSLAFQSLLTAGAPATTHDPLLFIRHNVGIVTIDPPGIVPVSVYPKDPGAELFWLRRILVEPVN